MAVNHKSLFCLRLCSVDCRNADVGNINEKAIPFSKHNPKPLVTESHTNTAQIYMMSPTAESQPSALSKKGGA